MNDRKPMTGAGLQILIVTVLALIGQGVAVATLSWQTSAIVALGWLAAILIVMTIEALRIGRRGEHATHPLENPPTPPEGFATPRLDR